MPIATAPPDTVTRLRVVLIDVREERRQLMRRVVEGTETGAIVVAEAGTEAAALELVGREQADAVVLDIQMPVQQGVEAIAALRAAFPQLAIVVCSFHLDKSTRQRALDAGAGAYLAKPISPRELNAALRQACAAAIAEP